MAKQARQKLLFVCSRNRWRSPTAQRLFARSPRFDARSRGLSSSAVRRLATDDVAWADVIFVMESRHRQQQLQAHRDAVGARPIHVLDIPDDYPFMDPELVDLLVAGVEARLGPS